MVEAGSVDDEVQPYPRVLHVIPSLEIGGTERQLVNFIIRSSRPENHFIALFDDLGPLAEMVPNRPILIGQVGRHMRSVPSNVRTARSLRRTIGELGVDLVHAHLDLSEILAAFATPRSIPLVASRRGHNEGIMDRIWLKPVEGLAHRRVDLMICNTHYLAEHTRSRDLWAPRIVVIHNAVDPEFFAPSPMPPPDPPTVVMVANIRPYKRHQDFLRSFRLVADAIPDARAVLVGDGAGRERLETLTHELGLSPNVEFVGQIPDPRPYLAAGHLAVLTSAREGFPNALLQAMATGRPVVATCVGGVPELVRNGVEGFLTSGDPREMAERMLSLLRNEELRTSMGGAARKRAESFGWDRVVREKERVYRDVLEGRARRRRWR